jgi:DNA-binding transcriptional MocR family regulator
MRNLSTGEPDPRLLPDLRRHLRALAASRQPATGYAQAGPLPELIELARQRFARDGVGMRGAAITVAGGALDGIERLLVTQLRPGDRVGVEDPGWANLLDLVAALGLEPVPVAGDQQGPDPDAVTAALRTGIRALVVTTRAQNPTGAALSRARSQALRDRLAAAPELLVIEDDHAAELSGVALHALAGATTHWAVVRSASKPYGPDLRMAVVAGDEATLARVAGRMRLGSGWVSTVLQRLLVHLWRDAAVADQIAAARDSYDQRRNGLLAELVARGLPATGRTGINVWVPVADETLAITRLREAGYAVAPGSLYRIGAPPGIRITVSPLDPPQIVPLADAVAAAVSLDSGRTRQDR